MNDKLSKGIDDEFTPEELKRLGELYETIDREEAERKERKREALAAGFTEFLKMIGACEAQHQYYGLTAFEAYKGCENPHHFLWIVDRVTLEYVLYIGFESRRSPEVVRKVSDCYRILEAWRENNLLVQFPTVAGNVYKEDAHFTNQMKEIFPLEELMMYLPPELRG